MAEEAALADRILQMQGTWTSEARREKIVAAKGFPEGWSVVAGLGFKDGRCFLSFHDFRSPDGKLWPSFEAASKYVISKLDYVEKLRELKGLTAAKRGRFKCMTCNRLFRRQRQCQGHATWHSRNRKTKVLTVRSNGLEN